MGKKGKLRFKKVSFENIYAIVAFFVVLALVSFIFYQRRIQQFGPTLVDNHIQMESLDRNNNGVPDTIKLIFSMYSEKEMTAWGGLEICLVNEYKIIKNCQSVSYNYPIAGGDGRGHSVFEKGKNQFIRYIYVNEPKNFKVTEIRLKAIGQNDPIMQRFVQIPVFNLNNFESVPFGIKSKNHEEYVTTDTPLE